MSQQSLHIQKLTSSKQAPIFPLIAMLYSTFSIASMVLAYKVIDFWGLMITGSALVMPFRYIIGDIIAEIYGYYVAKRMILYLIICWYVFSLTTIAIIHLPSPADLNHKEAYDLILGKTINTVTATLIAVIIGSNLNIYVVSKWKILVKGKYFWLRSIGSSAVGELTQYAIALPIVYYNMMSPKKIISLVILDFLVQLGFLIMISIPTNFIVFLIKKIENTDIYDTDIKFNPFVLSTPFEKQQI